MEQFKILVRTGRAIARIFCVTLLLALNTSAVFTGSQPILDEACADHACGCTMSTERTTCCCSGMTLPTRYDGPVLDELCMPGSPKLALFAKPGLQPVCAASVPPSQAEPVAYLCGPNQACHEGFRNLPDKVPIILT